MVNPFKRAVKADALKPLCDMPEEQHLLGDREQLKKVREARWKKRLASFPQPRAKILIWAEQMTAIHGNKKVRVWENEIDWIMALYIVRYGENEAYWPPNLSDRDIQRAFRWQADPRAIPDGVRYL